MGQGYMVGYGYEAEVTKVNDLPTHCLRADLSHTYFPLDTFHALLDTEALPAEKTHDMIEVTVKQGSEPAHELAKVLITPQEDQSRNYDIELIRPGLPATKAQLIGVPRRLGVMALLQMVLETLDMEE